VLIHVYNPTTQEAEEVDQKFEASQGNSMRLCLEMTRRKENKINRRKEGRNKEM
jgi:hypothetical protein